MKKKISKILGIGLALVLLASLMTFAIPVSADPYPPLDPAKPNMWEDFDPTPSGPPSPATDSWFYDPEIIGVGPIAESPVDGDIYASVQFLVYDDDMLAYGPAAGWDFDTEGDATAEWVCDIWHTQPLAAKVSAGYAYPDWAAIEIPQAGLPAVTLGDMDTITEGWSWWYYIDTADFGSRGTQMELRFQSATDPDGWAEMTVMYDAYGAFPAGPPTLDEWTEQTIISDTTTGLIFGQTEGGVAINEFPVGHEGTIADLVAHVIAADANAENWELIMARPGIGWITEPTTAYIDDVMIAGECYGFDPDVKFMKSTDGGRTWAESTSPYRYGGLATPGAGPVVDMVCSDLFEDVLWVTDGNYVYKSVDGATSFAPVAQDDLEKNLMGDCGIPITCKPITCIDVGYNGSDEPFVFIGTRQITNRTFVSPHPWEGDFVVGSVYWIADETFPASWHDLELKCYGCCDPEIEEPLVNASQAGCFDVYAVGCSPDFATSNRVYAVITTDDEDCDETADDPSTQVVYTEGTVCSWTFVSELCWDCVDDAAHSFEIRHASRIVFPSYYGTTPTLFVGVAGMFDSGRGGDVYKVAVTFPATTPAIDLNVQGGISGCIGLYDANICSLDIENDALVAGSFNNWQPATGDYVGTNVYYSADTGWVWAASKKDPTGKVLTYVLWTNGSVMASTSCCDCGVSLDCSATPAVFFNQISLISMDIDAVLDLSHAPGYLDGSSIMYVLTNDADACLLVDDNQTNTSLLRWDNTYWERVFSTFTYDSALANITALMDWVEASPDFDDTSCVYLANTEFEMFRSLDAGCSWAPVTFPCAPRPEISAWIVVDLETVLAAGPSAAYPQGEVVWKTTYHGAQPWIPYPVPTIPTAVLAGNGVDFDLSPTIATDNSVLLGDDTGRVFFSSDVGETWADILDSAPPYFFNLGANDTYVVFDPGYGTADDPGENTVYAAAGSDIARCTIDHDLPLATQDWLYLSDGPQDECDAFSLCVASGIDAAGDTALYVAEAGFGTAIVPTICGTMEVRYACGAEGADLCYCDLDIDEAFTVLDGTYECGDPVWIVSYNLVCDASGIVGTMVVEDLVTGALLSIDIDQALTGCTACFYNAELPDSNVFYVQSADLRVCCEDEVVCDTGVWRTLNPLDLIDESSGLNYVEFSFLDYMLTANSLLHPIATMPVDGDSVYPDDLWLTEGSNMLWALEDEGQGTPSETIWMWDDVLATPVILVAPADGSAQPLSTMVTLEWEALDNAVYYQVYVYRYCPTCPVGPSQLIEVENFETMKTCVEITDLLPGTTYYWKVRVACNSPQVSKWSELWSFDTALSSTIYCSPECGAEDISLTPNFSWSKVIGATSYEIDVATDEDFATIIASGTPTINAWDCATELDYSTTYYWRVRAISDGVPSAWTYCLFSTEAEPTTPAAPITPVTIVTEEITPVWIWVIIGIGAALVIAVIVLIVTTRRVS